MSGPICKDEQKTPEILVPYEESHWCPADSLHTGSAVRKTHHWQDDKTLWTKYNTLSITLQLGMTWYWTQHKGRMLKLFSLQYLTKGSPYFTLMGKPWGTPVRPLEKCYRTQHLRCRKPHHHYSDVAMKATPSEIIGVPSVYSTGRSGADQRIHQSFASLTFVRGIHRWPINTPNKGPVTRKMFPFHDVIMMQWRWGIQ